MMESRIIIIIITFIALGQLKLYNMMLRPQKKRKIVISSTYYSASSLNPVLLYFILLSLGTMLKNLI